MEIQWAGRREDEPFGPITSRIRMLRARRRDERRGCDALDGCDLPIDAGPLALVVLAVAVVLFIVFVSPWVVVIALGLAELTGLVVIAAGFWLWKTLARRPWHVTATSVDVPDVQQWEWRIVGWRQAKKLVAELRSQLSSGVSPSAIRSEMSIEASPHPPGPPPRRDGSPYRLDLMVILGGGILLAAALAVVIVLVNL